MSSEPIANAWVTTPAATDPVPAPPGSQHRAPSTTPAVRRPQPGAVDQPFSGLPVAPYAAPLTGGWWWLGCHGGAGVTTLCEAAGYVGSDAGRYWPAQGHHAAPVVLVARTHSAGLLAAQTAARQWASGALPWVNLLGLVLVADAPGRAPKPLRDLARLVTGGVPRHWEVPWVDPWRCGEPVAAHIPRAVRSLTADLTSEGATRVRS